MKNKGLLSFCFIVFYTSAIYAQSKITGTVFTEEGFSINKVLVYNINNQKKIYTDDQGKFTIEALPNEELRLIKDGYERKSIIITPSIFNLKVSLIRLPNEIEEVKLIHLSGDLNKDAKRIKIDNTKEQLYQNIGLPQPKGKQREKVPNLVNNVLLPMIGGRLNIDPLYKIISGDSRKMTFLYKYQDLQDHIKWIRDRTDDDYFINLGIPKIKIDEFLEFAISTNPKVLKAIKVHNLYKVYFELNESLNIFKSRISMDNQ